MSDPEWSHWSDREIAKHCRVSHTFVQKLRPEPAHTGNVSSIPEARTFTHHKTGQPTTMATANIGRPAETPSFARVAAAENYTSSHVASSERQRPRRVSRAAS